MTDNEILLARVASIICGASCGLVSECRSREAAQALFDAGYLVSAEANSHSPDFSEREDRSGVDVKQIQSHTERADLGLRSTSSGDVA